MDITPSGRKRLFFGSDNTDGDFGNAFSSFSRDDTTTSSSTTTTTARAGHAGHNHQRRPNKVPRYLLSPAMMKQTPQKDKEAAIDFEPHKRDNKAVKKGNAQVPCEDESSSHASPTVVTPNNLYPEGGSLPIVTVSSDIRNNCLGSATNHVIQTIDEQNAFTNTTASANLASPVPVRSTKMNLGQNAIIKDQELYEIGCSYSSLTNNNSKNVVLLTSTSDAVDVLADRMTNWSLTNVRKYKKKNNSTSALDNVEEKEEEGPVAERINQQRERRKLAKRDIMKLLRSSSTTKSTK